jgi:methyl-accepting chemotaxis protein
MNSTVVGRTRKALLHVNPTGPDVGRRRRLLNTLLTGMIALSALFVPLALIDNSVAEGLAIGAALLVMLAALLISRRGHPTPAAYLFVGTCCAITSAIMFTRMSANAALGYAPYMFTIPVIAIGVTAHRRAAFGIAALTSVLVIVADQWLPHLPRFEMRAGSQLYSLGAQPDDTTVGMIIILLFLCAFLSYALERVIVTALRETDHLATDLAQAEAEITQRARDAQLAAAVRAQSAALAATVQQQSTTANEQSSALQEISVTVEQLAATARQIADSGQDVQQQVARVLQNVEHGQDSDAATTRSVAHMDEQVAAIATQVQAVEGHVAQIRDIARVLAVIADNIHLLALNATIEAAGAGVQGRRFAVVAREVQDLADRARQASRQVQKQVVDIQAVTARASATTRAGQQAASEVVAQAQQTRAVHAQIRTIVVAANEQAEQIALGTTQQQMAVGQVMITLHNFVESMQEMAEGGRRVAGAAQKLSNLAGALDVGPVAPAIGGLPVGPDTRPDPDHRQRVAPPRPRPDVVGARR